MNTREKVLKEALNCVNGEREKQYGNPEDNFRRIADLWSTYLTSLFEDEKIVIDIDPIDVAKMMILFKIARSNGDKDKLDNYVDILGYGACAAEIFEGQERNDIPQKRIEVFPCDHIKVAEECRNCDYAKKCMGTGVCLKEEEEKCFHKPDNEQKDACDHAAYVSKGAIEIHKFVEDNRLSMDFDFEKSPKGRDIFNDAARAFIAGIGNSNVKITTFEAPKDWYLYDVFMNETGQIIVRFNTRKTKELTGIPSCDECLYGTQGATDDPCNKCLCDIHHKPFFIPKNKKDNNYGSYLQSYNNISACIVRESSKANVNPWDVVDNLTRNGHTPTEMAGQLMAGELNFDDVASYVDNAINELKKEETPKTTYKILKMTEDDKGVYLTVKEDKK